MKASDFERLKAVCKKEGFTIESYSGGKTAIIGVKDEWEGCEFIIPIPGCCLTSSICTNRIYKVVKIGKKWVDVINQSGENIRILSGYFKPSTEQAYKTQLEKIAFEKFGEIKPDDAFELEFTTNKKIKVGCNTNMYYEKEGDTLRIGGLAIYRQGKWATKLPERIEVEPRDCYQEPGSGDYYFGFHISKEYREIGVLQQFLASALEKFLNHE